MQKILIVVLALAAFEAYAEKSDYGTKYFNINPKSVDYKTQGDKEEHRFGVEVPDNKQFHHTTTAEDGVRLGCYGHVQDGKKFSTHYVADGRGYRLVPQKELITVYPKDGGEPRKASFVESFSKEEIKSSNIRYFFPEGCKLGYEVDAPPIKIVKKTEAVTIPTKTTTTTTTTTAEPETTTVQESQCFTQCCDEEKARIVLSPTRTGISKIVIPFETELLSRCSVNEIIEITTEQNNIQLLKKLLKFAKRYKL